MKKRKRISKAPDVRREELVQAAAVLFSEKGIAATGIGDITDRSEVARGTFYLYFASKDEVVAELWQRYVAGFMSLADGLLEDSQGLAQGPLILDLLVRLTEHALDHAHLHRLIYGTADASAIALCRQSDQAILERLTGVISRYFTVLGRKVNAELFASFLYHSLDGALHNAIMKNEPVDRATFINGVKQFAVHALEINVVP
ncbi:MAG: TetR/AcrR family transcriptional regulator [Hyphomicrobiales bacterium]|nr:TetR/AcrR family transcriptional regulator [Hyphomicrobiales bacterium]